MWELLLSPPIFASLIVQGLALGAMYALMGVGLALTFGVLGIVNFAHGEFFMIGSYVMYFAAAMLGLPIPLAIVLAGAVVFVFSAAVERGPIEQLRKRSDRNWVSDTFVLTIGLSIVLQSLAQNLFGTNQYGILELVGGAVPIGEIRISGDRLFLLATAILIGLATWLFLKYLTLGKGIRAASQSVDAAETLGIDVRWMGTITFALGGALAGHAGALLITIYPASPTVGAGPLVQSFAVVLLGGLGSVPGAILAGLLIGVLESFISFLTSSGWQNVLLNYLVIAVLLVRPAGLFVIKGHRP